MKKIEFTELELMDIQYMIAYLGLILAERRKEKEERLQFMG